MLMTRISSANQKNSYREQDNLCKVGSIYDKNIPITSIIIYGSEG
jgi:hypothetical protein